MAAFATDDMDFASWTTEPAHGSAGETGYAPSAAATDDTVRLNAATLNRRRRTMLSQIIEAEILPRLALCRASAVASATIVAPIIAAPVLIGRTIAAQAGESEIETAELVRLVMTEEVGAAVAFVGGLRTRGDTVEVLFLGVITAAARRLGEFWMEDRCDFAQVTISVGRLQQVVRSLVPDFQAAAVRTNGHSILLLPAPQEQHTFGLVLLGEFFRRAGWHVGGGPVSTGIDPAEIVREGWYDVAAFSIGSEVLLDGLTRCIRRVRRSSMNADLGVMVGGPLFLLSPDIARRVGADSTAIDAPGALRNAMRLVKASTSVTTG